MADLITADLLMPSSFATAAICFDISVLNNPIEQQCSSFNVLMADVLAKQPKMVRFCKVNVAESHLLEAVHWKQFRWIKSEEVGKRKLAEEAEKAKQEEA